MQTLASRRDLRLDFFRGLALWFIFIDHVPSSIVANVTFRNFGFSDADDARRHVIDEDEPQGEPAEEVEPQVAARSWRRHTCLPVSGQRPF